MGSRNECCGTCRYHRCDEDGCWFCGNDRSEFYVDWTEYDDVCDEYEERD